MIGNRERVRRQRDKRREDGALAFIERFASGNGMTPTYQEIADALRLRSVRTAHDVVASLADKGRVRLPAKQKWRGIEVVQNPEGSR